jgi:hypothetical protein
MARKFIETRKTTVMYFKDIHTNPSVETANKQENIGVISLTKFWKHSTLKNQPA